MRALKEYEDTLEEYYVIRKSSKVNVDGATIFVHRDMWEELYESYDAALKAAAEKNKRSSSEVSYSVLEGWKE